MAPRIQLWCSWMFVLDMAAESDAVLLDFSVKPSQKGVAKLKEEWEA